MPAKSRDNDVISPPTAPSDPPRTADERPMLRSYLDYFRTVLLRKCAGLDADQLAVTVAASPLTLGRLLRHMAWVEDVWFAQVLHDREPAAEWVDADWTSRPDWEMDAAADFTAEELARQFQAAVTRSRAAVDGVDLDDLAARPGRGGATSLRWIAIHMIEEYAHHCGHADLLREAVDRSVGD